MIEYGEIFSRCRTIRMEFGVYARGLLASLAFAAFGFAASGQSSTSSNADWSVLTPPPSVASDTNSVPSDFISTNLPAAETAQDTNSTETNGYQADLAMAGYYKKTNEPGKAEPILINLLNTDVPVTVQKSALLQLAVIVRDENDLPRAPNYLRPIP